MSFRNIGAAILIAAVLGPAAAAAESRDGAYLSVSGSLLDFQRDLRHSRTLWHFDKEFFVPRLNRGAAVSIGYGRKTQGRSWEVSALFAPRTVSLPDGDHSASFRALEMNGRSYFVKRGSLHPYFQGGITIAYIRVKDGCLYLGEKLNAAYAGGGLSAGVGIVFDLGPSLILNIGARYRLIGFLYAFGEGKGRDINDLRIEYQGAEFGRLLRTDIVSLTVGIGFAL